MVVGNKTPTYFFRLLSKHRRIPVDRQTSPLDLGCWSSEHELPSSEHELPSSEHELPSSEHELPSSEHELPSIASTSAFNTFRLKEKG